MTLLVGIRCTDGVVIAADSAVTFGAGQMTTISDSQCKIEIIQDQLIVAGTGQVGLGQRFRWVVDRVWQDPNCPKDDRVEAPRVICATALNNFGSTQVKQGCYGALLAYPAGDSAELCEFAIADMQPELKTETMWYASMGLGTDTRGPLPSVDEDSVLARWSAELAGWEVRCVLGAQARDRRSARWPWRPDHDGGPGAPGRRRSPRQDDRARRTR